MASSRRINTKSIIKVLGDVTYEGQDAVNIFKKINIEQSTRFEIGHYDEYIIQETDRWDVISNNFYGTPILWWVIARFNKIQDPFAELEIGNTIKIIKAELIPSLLLELQE